jgi:tRNA (guanine6-N2)-methyltransferase
MRQPREKGAAPRPPRPQKFPRPSAYRERKPPAKNLARSLTKNPAKNPAPATHNSGRARPAPLRAGPGVYIVQTQPGFESIAWSEITATIPRAKKIGTRTVPARAGMLIFEAPRAAPLSALRCAEDLFAVVAYRHGLDDDATSLDKVRAAIRGCTHLDEALNARVAIVKGARAGKKLRFKVVARLSGDHEFRRVDFKHAVETGILEHGDHLWRLNEDDAEVEFWATMLRDELIFTLRISDDTMRFRDYKIAHRPGSLRPSVAAALAWVSNPLPDEVFLDPMCGTATVLIERAHLGRYGLLLGGDAERETLEAARENIGPRYKPIEIKQWDATALPLENSSVDKIVSNLPWGIKHGSHPENRRLYPRLIAEFRRVLKPGGTMVLLSAEMRLMSELWTKVRLRPSSILNVTVLGAPASIYVCQIPTN